MIGHARGRSTTFDRVRLDGRHGGRRCALNERKKLPVFCRAGTRLSLDFLERARPGAGHETELARPNWKTRSPRARPCPLAAQMKSYRGRGAANGQEIAAPPHRYSVPSVAKRSETASRLPIETVPRARYRESARRFGRETTARPARAAENKSHARRPARPKTDRPGGNSALRGCQTGGPVRSVAAPLPGPAPPRQTKERAARLLLVTTFSRCGNFLRETRHLSGARWAVPRRWPPGDARQSASRL